MAGSGQSKTVILLALVAGGLLLFGAVVGIQMARSGTPVLGVSGWTVPVLAGVLLAVTALLLIERPTHRDTDLESRGTSCAACGKPIIKEWRLCPHCGQLLECDISLPIEGGSNRG